MSAAAADGNDESFLMELAKLAKAPVSNGFLDDRLARKALMNVYVPEFSRALKEAEVRSLHCSC